MVMLNTRVSVDIYQRLSIMATESGRPKSYYVRKAIEEWLEDHEDGVLALAQLEKGNTPISLDEMVKRLGLQD